MEKVRSVYAEEKIQTLTGSLNLEHADTAWKTCIIDYHRMIESGVLAFLKIVI